MVRERPPVSIVMPVHNGGADLSEALSSIEHQTFTDYELVVVDDHSTDGTAETLRRAAASDRRIRVVEPADRGFVAAVSTGIEASTGAWIARMDADDRSHPDRLARQFAHLEANPDVDLVGTAVQVIEPDGTPGVVVRYPLHHPLITLALRSANTFAHGTVVVRRTALASVGGYRSAAFPVEDYDLWCRLIGSGFVTANLDEPLYDYRLSPGGVSRLKAERQAEMLVDVGATFAASLGVPPRWAESWRAVGSISCAAADGLVGDRALARAAQSTRRTVVPWMRSRRWGAAGAAAVAAMRAEAAYRRRRLAAALPGNR